MLSPPENPTPLWSDNPSARDLLGFADIAAPVLEALAREKLDPVTVGVSGSWGSGKSSILSIIERALATDEKVVLVNTRPWEYDPNTDPKATLISEVLAALHAHAAKDKTRAAELADRFKKLAGRIRWSKAITLAANSALTISLPKIEDITGLFGEDEEAVADPSLQGFREEFAALLRDMPEIERVVVIVDDLDRCLPHAVIATLEAIKLFLSVEKMAFVLAADERLVTHAIAQRYEPAPRAEEMAREYLEKIVQIPLPIPTLGLADTEAYLALTLLETHFESDDDAYAAIIDHCDARRRAAEEHILYGLAEDAIPEKARGDVQLATMLAPVLYRELGGNPRRLKRFLNAYWIRSTIAGSRGIALGPTALAKLMVLETLYPDEFGIVLGWLASGELQQRLGRLEQPAGKPSRDGRRAEEVPEKLREWAELAPPIADVDLGPYLRLAASLRSIPAAGAALRPELRELLDQLAGGDAERKEAQKRATKIAVEDRLELVRHLARALRAQPMRQNQLGEGIGELARSAPELATEAAALLRELDPAQIQPALPVRLVPGKGAPDALVALVGEWAQSERTPERARRAAQAQVEAARGS